MVSKANEAALTVVVTDGWPSCSVVHFAARGQRLANIEYLHALDPSLMAIRCDQGETTLHFATHERINFAVLKFRL